MTAYRSPSVETITRYLRIDPRAAKGIKIAMIEKEPDTVLGFANRVMNGHGVEAIRSEYAWIDGYYQNTVALYVNMGDTYAPTVLYDTAKNTFYVTSWGDWYEHSPYYRKELAAERRYERAGRW